MKSVKCILFEQNSSLESIPKIFILLELGHSLPLLQKVSPDLEEYIQSQVKGSMPIHSLVLNSGDNNVSVQTTDISNGFIADVSANSMEALSAALTETLTNRIQHLFQTMDPSNNNLGTLFTTNISLTPQRDYRQSPITTENRHYRGFDNSGNDPDDNTRIEPVD